MADEMHEPLSADADSGAVPAEALVPSGSGKGVRMLTLWYVLSLLSTASAVLVGMFALWMLSLALGLLAISLLGFAAFAICQDFRVRRIREAAGTAP